VVEGSEEPSIPPALKIRACSGGAGRGRPKPEFLTLSHEKATSEGGLDAVELRSRSRSLLPLPPAVTNQANGPHAEQGEGGGFRDRGSLGKGRERISGDIRNSPVSCLNTEGMTKIVNARSRVIEKQTDSRWSG
jgi:hypothetical protein